MVDVAVAQGSVQPEEEQRAAFWAQFIVMRQRYGAQSPQMVDWLRGQAAVMLTQELAQTREQLAQLEQDIAVLQRTSVTSLDGAVFVSIENKQREARVLRHKCEYAQAEISNIRKQGTWASDDTMHRLLNRFGFDMYMQIVRAGFSYVKQAVSPLAQAFVRNLGGAGSVADGGAHWEPVIGGKVHAVAGDGSCGYHTVAAIADAHVSQALQAMPGLTQRVSALSATTVQAVPVAATQQGVLEAEIKKQVRQADEMLEHRKVRVSIALARYTQPQLQALFARALQQEISDRINKTHNSDYLARAARQPLGRDELLHVLVHAAANMDTIYQCVVTAPLATTGNASAFFKPGSSCAQESQQPTVTAQRTFGLVH